MKIIMTNADIIYNYQLLNKFFNNEETIELPIQVNYSIQKNLFVLSNCYLTLENLRKGVGKKYGDPLEGGAGYKIKPENLLRAEDELNQLNSFKEEVEIKKINLSDLEGVKLSPGQMQALLFMIEEE